MKLFEEEWVAEACRRVAADAVFQKKGKGFNAVYQYVVKAAPAAGCHNEYRFAIKYPEATLYWMGDHEKPDFVMTTSYQVIHDILMGKTSAVMAISLRKAFVSGSLPTLLRFTGAIDRVVELFKTIAAEADGQLAPIGH